MKILFVEALYFIFNNQDREEDFKIYEYNKEEVYTPIPIPLRGSLGNILFY